MKEGKGGTSLEKKLSIVRTNFAMAKHMYEVNLGQTFRLVSLLHPCVAITRQPATTFTGSGSGDVDDTLCHAPVTNSHASHSGATSNKRMNMQLPT